MRVAVFQKIRPQAVLIAEVLEAMGHHCQLFEDPLDLISEANQNPFDLLIVDDPQPACKMVELVSSVRGDAREHPSVLLTCDCEDKDSITIALDTGIDDYLVRPLRRSELATRAHILLTRAYPERLHQEILDFGEYQFDPHSRRVLMDGYDIELTRKEFDLALLFFRHLGRPLSRATILEAIWSKEVPVPSRTVDTHVSRVRTKLRLEPGSGFRLAPVYSYGYLLERLPI